jgi:hypothetical protein
MSERGENSEFNYNIPAIGYSAGIIYTFVAFDHIGRSHIVAVRAHTYLEAKDAVLSQGYYQACLARNGDEIRAQEAQ